MNKFIIFAVVAFAAVACVNAKPGYISPPYAPGPITSYESPIYLVPSGSSAAAAAAAASSVPNLGYVYDVPSYSIDGGLPGYGVINPVYRNNYAPIY